MTKRCLTLLDKYLLSSSAICGMSKVLETWDVKVERYSGSETIKTDMLMGEKFQAFVFSAATGPAFLPFKIFKWMDDIDIYMKGQKPSDYGVKEKKSVYDYIYP